MRTIAIAVLSLMLAGPALAQEVAIGPADSVQSVVTAHKGKRVTLRLRSGQELTGTVRDVNPKLVVLGAVAGRELFDAVVSLEHVDAVLIRTKQ